MEKPEGMLKMNNNRVNQKTFRNLIVTANLLGYNSQKNSSDVTPKTKENTAHMTERGPACEFPLSFILVYVWFESCSLAPSVGSEHILA